MRRLGIELLEDGHPRYAWVLRLPTFANLSIRSRELSEDYAFSLACPILLLVSNYLCVGRELNPGYELGKLMSYH